ncbi:MAG: UDP-N-acetylmuramoyl-L-alanyl-D-glutamate--2,6-diaminopimelate ligase [Alphaproteobacteria bacterium]|nr:UDP-N-acetylmuramoyl-L-alanyl-D-glutamate--2,6-diaminopimelate ligase [Alphaproteobacteria bacterium]
MKILIELLHTIRYENLIGNIYCEINQVVIDSRVASKNGLFFALKGTQVDGHKFIDKAIEQGAVAIVYENDEININPNITYIKVEHVANVAGHIIHAFYNNPSTKLNLVGVTGTNGKTTCATLLFNLFSKLGYECGLISTVENRIGTHIFTATHTTPNSIIINELLQEMVANNCSYVFMECSSHAIEQGRIAGLCFKGAIFTNLTQDHLDYHLNFENYFKAKKIFFDSLQTTSFALTNCDDAYGNRIIADTKATKYTYSLNALSDFKADVKSNLLNGLKLRINNNDIETKLVGSFNAYNVLAIYAAAILLGVKDKQVISLLKNLEGAEGRFDCVHDLDNRLGIVDYAHTADALENVLKTIISFIKPPQKVVVVFGCGGNRDKTKRPFMLSAVAKFAHDIIITTDNPRFEAPEQIVNDMLLNFDTHHVNLHIIYDRKEAIAKGYSMLLPHDILLVAGKGHEKYQEVQGERQHFDDKEILLQLFKPNS